MTNPRRECMCLTPAKPTFRNGVSYCTRCTNVIDPRKRGHDLSSFIPKETTFKVDCMPSGLTAQIVLRVGPQSIAVPAYRRDDDDFEKMTYLSSISFNLVDGGIELRYLELEGKQ